MLELEDVLISIFRHWLVSVQIWYLSGWTILTPRIFKGYFLGHLDINGTVSGELGMELNYFQAEKYLTYGQHIKEYLLI